ncbi:MAG: hypothetical protein R6W80_06575 [Haliea sp.]
MSLLQALAGNLFLRGARQKDDAGGMMQDWLLVKYPTLFDRYPHLSIANSSTGNQAVVV